MEALGLFTYEQVKKYVEKMDKQLDEIDKAHKSVSGRSHASGGMIPGFGGGDNVPAFLEKGEFVMNKDATKAYAPLLFALNAQKFATGGPVIPKPETALAAGGGGHPRVNINVRGDSASAIKRVVMEELDATLDAMMTPTGTHARLYDPTL